MDYFLNEEQLMIRDLARQIAQEKIVPVRLELDEKNEFPREIIKAMAQADLLGIYIPRSTAASARGAWTSTSPSRRSPRRASAFRPPMRRTRWVPTRSCSSAPRSRRKKYLPDIAAGKKLVAFGLTEANAGSDASGIQTTAKLDGNEYVLNGTKQWITNGGEAEVYTIIAITDKSKGPRGASAFVVEKGTPGFTFGKKENKMGIRASCTTELIFSDCRIPRENLIAKQGMGFIVAMKTSTAPGPAWAPRAWAWRRAPSMKRSSSPSSASSSASPSPPSRRSSTCWPTCRR